MSEGKSTSTNRPSKKEDGRFPSKNIKHDPLAESARAVFGQKDENTDKEFNRDKG